MISKKYDPKVNYNREDNQQKEYFVFHRFLVGVLIPVNNSVFFFTSLSFFPHTHFKETFSFDHTYSVVSLPQEHTNVTGL